MDIDDDRVPPSSHVGWRVSLPLLALVWIVGLPVLLYGSVIMGASFFGEAPGPAQVVESHRLLVAATGVAVVVPVLGLLVAGRIRSRAGLWLFAILLLLGGGLAFVVGLDAYRSSERDRPPPPRITTCQEHSGGGTSCPGG